MDRQTRDEVFRRLRATEDSIMLGKGDEYSQGSVDVNRNFKVVADLLRGAPLDDLTVAAVYFLKHVVSVCDYVIRRPEQPPSGEGIESRVNDARNYLGILLSIIEERKDEDRRGQMLTYDPDIYL